VSLPSYLLSALHARYGRADLPAFTADHPEAWVVWEPGPWHPAGKGRTEGVVPIAGQLPPAPTQAEALAIQLRLDDHHPQVTLGRDEACAIPVNDATLSRHHLTFARGFEGWTVEDTGSSNGSWLGMAKLKPGQPVPLRDGAQLQAGRVFLTFHEPAGMLARLQASRP
jgi:hypothetical protein